MSDNDQAQDIAEACVDSLMSRDKATQHLDMKTVKVAPGYAAVSMTIQSFMLNGHDTCHGGYIFALADSAFAFACNSHNANNVAQHCSIDYVMPGRCDDVLTATAEERALTGRTGLYDVTIKNQNDEVVAYFRGKSYRIRGTVLPEE